MRVEPIEKLLPETLAQAREICGLTQEAFALAVGVSRSFVALVETERYEDFRTGLTFAEVKSMFWISDLDSSKWKYKRPQRAG